MQKNNIIRSKIYTGHLPWNEFSEDALGPVTMEFVNDNERFFKRWSQKFYENFQFIYGNHSLKWSKKHGFAVDVDFLRRSPSVNMRAQTNLARVVLEALASLIYSNIPTWDTTASDDSSTKGKRYEKIVEKLLDAYMERLCMDREFATAAMIYTAYGQVGAKVQWNKHLGNLIEVPQWRKIQAPVHTTYMAPNPYTGGLIETHTPVKDGQGNPRFEDRWEPVVDEMGRQVIDKMFSGDASIRILTPFEYRRPLGSPGMHKDKYIQEIRLIDYDEFLDEYGDLDGQTKHFKDIVPVYQNRDIYGLAVKHYMRMIYTTPPTSDDYSKRNESPLASKALKHKVLVVEHYDRPHHKKWKKGRRIVIANGQCTHMTTPDYSTNKLDGWHPYAEAQWMNLAPSSMSSGPLNDVIAKNKELNIKDSLIATAVRRNMGSTLLTKNGSGIDVDKLTGEPGQVQEVMDPFAARWLHDELPIPPSINKIRETDKEDVYETSGSMDALRGDRTVGVSSGYHAKQIQEREERRLAPARKNFGGFASTIGEKLVSCVKANVVRLDDSMMGFMIRSGAGEFQSDDVISFVTSPIDFGIDVKVDVESMAVKSKATMQATLMELGGGPLAQRLGQDAKVLDKFLKYFDAETLRDGSSAHRDRAERENSVFQDILRLGPDTAGIPKPIVFFEDDDDIHMAEHVDFLVKNSDQILRNEVFLEQFLLHMERHRIQKQEKMGEAMPGTNIMVPQMMNIGSQNPIPDGATISQDSQARAQREQAQAGPPQAPRQPNEPGQPGPNRTDPNAPSQNTSAAAQGGPPQ